MNIPLMVRLIEHLEFISLDNKFDRAAMIINPKVRTVKKVQDLFNLLLLNVSLKQCFTQIMYVKLQRDLPEEGLNILLDQETADILVQTTLDLIANLSIRRAKGYIMSIVSEVDYNDSNKMMRIKRVVQTKFPLNPKNRLCCVF